MTLYHSSAASKGSAEKSVARSRAYTYARKYVKRAKTALYLTTPDLLDIRHDLSRGLITLDTQIYVVEKIKSVAEGIRNNMKQIEFRKTPIVVHGELAEWTPPEPIQYAFVDLCGVLTDDMEAWLSKVFIPNMMPGGVLNVTLTACHRGMGTIRHWEEQLETDPGAMRYANKVCHHGSSYEKSVLLAFRNFSPNLVPVGTYDYTPMEVKRALHTKMCVFSFRNPEPKTKQKEHRKMKNTKPAQTKIAQRVAGFRANLTRYHRQIDQQVAEGTLSAASGAGFKANRTRKVNAQIASLTA